MPKLLADRIGSDTIEGLGRAADQRAVDAEALIAQGRPLAAIYLFGYEVELRIKAAYFRFFFAAYEVPPGTAISRGLRQQVTSEWETLGLEYRPGPHDILGWSQLLIAKRADRGDPYDPSVERALIVQAGRVAERWSETLRYRSNIPYLHEVHAVRDAAVWFRDHRSVL